MPTNVCVIGAGVIELSTAVRIQESLEGVRITLVADKFSPDTTSDGAGGIWRPYLVNETQAKEVR